MRRLWLFLMMLLLACLFMVPANAMASFDEGGPPGIVAMIDIETVIGVMVSIAGQDEPANINMLKDRTFEPTDWGSAISPIACGNNVLLHGHPGGVSMALT